MFWIFPHLPEVLGSAGRRSKMSPRAKLLERLQAPARSHGYGHALTLKSAQLPRL
jgi:hypothetical protein